MLGESPPDQDWLLPSRPPLVRLRPLRPLFPSLLEQPGPGRGVLRIRPAPVVQTSAWYQDQVFADHLVSAVFVDVPRRDNDDLYITLFPFLS